MYYNGYYNSYYCQQDNFFNSYRVNMETAIQIALQQVPGQVIKVELEYEHGRLIYEVKIRTMSGVYEVEIDANTGQVLEIKRD